MDIDNLIMLFTAGILLLLVKLAVIIYLLAMFNKKQYLLRQREQQLSMAVLLQGEREIMLTEVGKTIHDDVVQVACLLKQQIYKLEKFFNDEKHLAVAAEAHRWADVVIDQSNKLALDLNTEFIKCKCIHSLIEDELKLAKEHNGIEYQITSNGNLEHFGQEARMLIYRIAKEGIANSLKHGMPSLITVKMDQEGTTFNMAIEDDGSGIMPEKIYGIRGNGLPNMQYRAKILKGGVSLNSVPKGGCRLELNISDTSHRVGMADQL
jgi:signal transduction histidine kinase